MKNLFVAYYNIIFSLRSTNSDMQKELRDFEMCKQDLSSSKKNYKSLEEKVDKLQRMMEELRQTKEREFNAAKRDWENQFEMVSVFCQLLDHGGFLFMCYCVIVIMFCKHRVHSSLTRC